jgi:spermidine/putrescine transport system substrate-binding protein
MKMKYVQKVVLFCLITVLISGCSPKGQGPVLLEWSGYEQESFWEPYKEQHPDALPVFSFFADDSEGFAKAKSGFAFDLVHPCSSWWKLYVDHGLVQPIDTSRITHLDTFYPDMLAMGQFNGQQYFLPWEWGYESILVRTDLAPDIPESWADLWDPQYSGHISMYDASEAAYLISGMSLGIDPYNATPAEQEQIKQHLIDLKPALLNYWLDYTEIIQLVAQGDVWLASHAWNDAYGVLLEEGYEVEFINPTEGRLSWICGFGIGANETNLDLAYDYLNAVTAPQSMANMGNEFYYGVASQQATDLLDPFVVEILDLEDPAVLENTFFYQPLSEELRTTIEAIWSDVKASN